MLRTLVRTLRALRRAPLATALAILSLGLGIGLSTAALSLIESHHARPTPIASASEVVDANLLGNAKPQPSTLDELDWLRRAPGIRAATAFGRRTVALETAGRTETTSIAQDPPGFFAMLGIKPAAGRFPDAEERRTGNAVLVSDTFWQLHFLGRSELRDASLSIDGRRVAIVGVLPRGFEDPPSLSSRVWLPLPSDDALAGAGNSVIVRLAPDADRVVVQNALRAAAATFSTGASTAANRFRYALSPLVPPFGSLRSNDYALVVAGMAVLVIACVNVAALMLARGIARQRDVAVRRALGASQLSVAGDVLWEVALLSIGGLALGLIVASLSIQMLAKGVPPESLVITHLPVLSGRVFSGATALLVVVVWLAGTAPVLHAARLAPSSPMKDQAGTTTGRFGFGFPALVAVELAAAMVLVLSAALLTRSAQRLADQEFGYDMRGLLRASIRLRVGDTDMPQAQRRAMVAAMERAIRDLPNVADVTTGTGVGAVMVTAAGASGDDSLNANGYRANGGFVQVIGIPIVAGRDFDQRDAEQASSVILSQLGARTLFGSERGAIGSTVHVRSPGVVGRALTVVGVSRDVRLAVPSFGLDPDAPPVPAVFIAGEDPASSVSRFVIRARGDTAAAQLAVDRTLRTMLPAGSTFSVAMWSYDFESQLRSSRVSRNIFAMLGVAALLLSAVGVFSVLSFATGRRMREFGVRIALGASPGSIGTFVIRGAVHLTLAGVAVGLMLSIWMASFLGFVMQGLEASNGSAFVAVTILAALSAMLLVTVGAALLPAWRASRADPMSVLRAT